MKNDTPRYVVRLKGVLYFKRRSWPTRKFKAQEIGPAFFAEYATILNGVAPQPRAYLVSGLVASYYRSKMFEKLAERTKADYRKFLDRFDKNAGTVTVKDIEIKHVVAWRDQLAQSNGAHYANYFVRVLKVLFKHANQIGEIKGGFNPAHGVEAIKYDKQKPKPWPRDMIEAARAARPHNDRTRLLFELLYCTGQRIGDALSAKWSDVRGDSIEVSQNKTGTPLVLPMTPDLMECLKHAERAGETILTAYRKETPWKYRGAADAMMKLRREIGAEAYTIHGIRHTVASELGESGVDDDGIMAVTGHKSKGMVAHYAGEARQRVRAEKAQKERK